MTLEQYLKNNLDNDVTDHVLRVVIQEGRTCFSIHPTGDEEAAQEFTTAGIFVRPFALGAGPSPA